MQRNLAKEAANQRQLSLRHIGPEPFEDMFDLDNQAEMFDNQMTSEHKTKLRDWQLAEGYPTNQGRARQQGI